MTARRRGRAGSSCGARWLWVAGVTGVLAGVSAARTTVAAPEARDGGRGALAFAMVGCPWTASAVERIVRLELGMEAEAHGEASPGGTVAAPAADRLSIQCHGAEVTIAALGGEPTRTSERSLGLTGATPAAAERTIALAGVELLASVNPTIRQRLDARAGAGDPAAARVAVSPSADGAPTRVETASRTRTAPSPESAPSPVANAPVLNTGASRAPTAVAPVVVPPAVSEAPPDATQPVESATAAPAPAPATEAVSATRLTMAALWTRFPTSAGLSAWGGRVIADRRIDTAAHPLMVSFNADAGTDRRTVAAGRVRATLLSLGACVGLPLASSAAEVILGLGVRAGVVRLSGEPSDGVSSGHVAWSPWAAPAVSARAFVGGRFGVDVGIEAGMSLIGAQATANGAPAAAATGPYGAVSVGFSMKTKKR